MNMIITKSLFRAIVPAMLALTLMAGPVLAQKKPPPEDAVCSPGWWKNHVEEWQGTESDSCDFDATEVDQLLTWLTAKGHGSKAIREAAADALAICFDPQPCVDD